MYIFDSYGRIVFQVLAQFGDVHVHTTCGKIVVLLPDAVQCCFTGHDVIHVLIKQVKKGALLG